MLKWIPIKSSIANNKGIYTFVYRKWLSLKYVLDWAEHLQQGLYTPEGVEYTTPFIAYTRWQIAKWFEYTLNLLSKLLLRLYCNHICRDFSLIRDFPGGSEGKTSVVKLLSTVRETWVRSLSQENTAEKQMATHSSTLA